MPYELKYTFSFKDRHTVTPATWRVDILDGEEAAGSVYTLVPSGDPLITERIETDDEKATYIIGRQITFSYEYTGVPNEPLPELFFEANERRWRVEVYRNNILDGVYYVKPDFSSRQWKAAPYTITLKAVDGLSYAKGVKFKAYDDDGTLHYGKITSYEAIMTRALSQIIDPGTPINVLCSLFPSNIEAGKRLLNGTFIHTDIFFDFVTGAATVHEVLTALCKGFYARCFIARGQVWFVRMQDLTSDTFTVERYADENSVADVDAPEMLATAGPSVGLYDAVPVDDYPELPMVAALKKATFETNYKGINRLGNFTWEQFDGTDFTWWIRSLGTPAMQRGGDGTAERPYFAIIPFSDNVLHNISQGQLDGSPDIFVEPGQIIDLELKYIFANTKTFAYLINLDSEDPDYFGWTMDSGGGWVEDRQGIESTSRQLVSRSSRKRDGSLKVKSLPIPAPKPDGSPSGPAPTRYKMSVHFFTPFEVSDTSDGPFIQAVWLYPPKVGVINVNSKGRAVVVTNQAQFSRVKDEAQPFMFIDTGDEGSSNSIFTGADQEPVDNWESIKPGIAPDDIERHMARAHIDQYRRSLQSWEGALYSNTLEYYSVIEFPLLPGKRFMQLRDTYNNLTCTHECSLIEIMEEGSAQVDILEYDIEEERE